MGCLTKPQSTSDFLPYVVGGASHTGRKRGQASQTGLWSGSVRLGKKKKTGRRHQMMTKRLLRRVWRVHAKSFEIYYVRRRW